MNPTHIVWKLLMGEKPKESDVKENIDEVLSQMENIYFNAKRILPELKALKLRRKDK